MMRGIGKLETPRDLLAKLTHDFARLTSDPSDIYAAFDFFVTAEHMADWVLPGYVNRRAQAELRSRSPVLEAISHIASGSKHFVAEARHHQHVQHVDAPQGAFDSRAFDPHAFQTDALFVTLDGVAAEALGQHMLAIDLADKALRFWKEYVEQNC